VFGVVFAVFNVWSGATHESSKKERAASLLLSEDLDEPNDVPRRDRSGGEHPERFWKYIPDARHTRLAMLVGMSQLLYIYERKRGEHFISEHMDDELASSGVRVFELAAGNLDNEEALSYLLATILEPQTRPYAFIYGVCFDKFRNVDVRPSFQRFMQQRSGLLQAWQSTAAAHQQRYPRATEKMVAMLKSMTDQARQTREESFESRLRARVARWLPIVDARQELNAVLQNELYLLRNAVLRIKNSSKRPIIGSRYDLNLEFMELLADVAAENNVKFLPYIIPLNPMAETPYVGSEYRDFKLWFAAFTKRRSLPFVNLENLVPPEEWGLLRGAPDFKHFRARAHRRTASALVTAFRNELVDQRPSPPL
jgi:hypothetical protein